MAARVGKRIFRSRLREAILHFRTVGATNVEKEMKQYAANMFSMILGCSERSLQFYESKIKPALKGKFGCDITSKQFGNVHRPALFIALQYHVQ
jgi:hypothetical protein